MSAPASLLLLGEYAVLEEGGLGVAVAPDVRVVATPSGAAGAADLSGNEPWLVGRYPGGNDCWPGDGLLSRVCDFLSSEYGPPRFAGQWEIDSSQLFREDGAKRGFGSSAALAVVVTSLWLQEHNHDVLFPVAAAAHRQSQGGRGSGYDVACSTHGGVIRFCGGSRPAASPVGLHWLPELTLFPGLRPVKTPSAVSAYKRWKEDSPAQAAAYLQSSNALVEAFLTAKSWPTARQIVGEYAELAVLLGDAIGVDARIDPPTTPAPGAFKAVGAGNELGVLFGPVGPGHADDDATVIIARDGVEWE